MRSDYTIEINDYYIHLDAKYKLDINPDILKMHSYKDGILNSKAAFILYPSNKQFIRKIAMK